MLSQCFPQIIFASFWLRPRLYVTVLFYLTELESIISVLGCAPRVCLFVRRAQIARDRRHNGWIYLYDDFSYSGPEFILPGTEPCVVHVYR